MSVLSAPYFHDETAAIKHLESIIWADGVVCPKCGVVDNSGELKGKTGRPGLRKCYACRKQFTVKVGTVFESSHIPLHKWLQAAFLMASSKKGISSHQLHRVLEVTYKTAWFMTHRLREAMRTTNTEPMGGEGKIVEADETFIGNKGDKPRHSRGGKHKHKVFSLVERGGNVRSFHVDDIKVKTLKPILMAQVKKETRLMTDEFGAYKPIGKEFISHETVMHSADEYGRGDVYTNTIEGFFSIFKRGMKGVYQHCGEQHLKRYLAEFDFRYNGRDINDSERTGKALSGIVGKRLLYRDSSVI